MFMSNEELRIMSEGFKDDAVHHHLGIAREYQGKLASICDELLSLRETGITGRVMDTQVSSRRDMFAAAALQGIIATTTNMDDWPKRDVVAIVAIEYADAMITALDKPAEEEKA